MELVWENPEEGFAKINIHFVEATAPLLNGNLNGLGVVVCNVAGAKLWGVTGPVRGMIELPPITWGARAGTLDALSLGFHRSHIDLDNKEAYDTLRVQEFIFLPPDLEDAFGQFNTLFSNHFIEDITARQVSIMPETRNSTAIYMEIYGMNNLSALVQDPGVFANLQYILDRDMGMILPSPEFDLMENFGKVK